MDSNLIPIFSFLTFLPFILFLILTGVGIYFIVKVIKFLNTKTKLDEERNAKINELIEAIRRDKSI